MPSDQRHLAFVAGPRGGRGFSLVEMVMVLATLGIIAMIAVPRMSAAATDAQASAVVANITVLQNAIDMYEAEHNNLTPAHDSSQAVSVDGARFAARLIGYTDELGGNGGIYGPYLLRVPRNPANGKSTIRVDGLPPGTNAAGWRFDSTRRRIMPDHLDEAKAVALIKLRGIGKPASLADVGVEGAVVVEGPE